MRVLCRSMSRGAVLLALLGVSAAACGGDDDDGDDGGAVDAAPGGQADASAGEGPALAEVGGALAEALCPRLFECCSASDLRNVFDDVPEGLPDVAACIAAVTPAVGESIDDLAASIGAGRLAYDPGRMGDCLAEIAAASCAAFAGELHGEIGYAACDASFAGLVERDGGCAADSDCRSGYCVNQVNDALGSCAELPGLGERCDVRCAEGFTCDSIGEVCLSQRDDGETCDGEEQCSSGACLDGVCGRSPICDGEG